MDPPSPVAPGHILAAWAAAEPIGPAAPLPVVLTTPMIAA